MILGLETSPAIMERIGGALILINQVVLAVFVVEILVKLYAFGFRFFRSGWNVFDFLVVGIALVPATGPLEVLRAKAPVRFRTRAATSSAGLQRRSKAIARRQCQRYHTRAKAGHGARIRA